MIGEVGGNFENFSMLVEKIKVLFLHVFIFKHFVFLAYFIDRLKYICFGSSTPV